MPLDVIKRAKRVLESIEMENRILMEYTAPEGGEDKKSERVFKHPIEPSRMTQLVFDPVGEPPSEEANELINEIKELSLENLTPLQALNVLYELKKKVDE